MRTSNLQLKVGGNQVQQVNYDVAVTSNTACIVAGESKPTIGEKSIPGWIPYGVKLRASLVPKKRG